MSRRRHLGSIYTTYPAKLVNEYLGDKLFKLLSSAAICVILTGVEYVGVSVVNFLNNELLKANPPTDHNLMFKSETNLWVLLGAYIVVFIVVFRRKTGERGARQSNQV